MELKDCLRQSVPIQFNEGHGVRELTLKDMRKMEPQRIFMLHMCMCMYNICLEQAVHLIYRNWISNSLCSLNIEKDGPFGELDWIRTDTRDVLDILWWERSLFVDSWLLQQRCCQRYPLQHKNLFDAGTVAWMALHLLNGASIPHTPIYCSHQHMTQRHQTPTTNTLRSRYIAAIFLV